jgi:SOS-response transcriptional repressor LexA
MAELFDKNAYVAKRRHAANPARGRVLARVMTGSHDCKTQSDLAKRSGVAQSTIGRMLRGDVNPQTATLERIAKALGIPVAVLLDESPADELGSRVDRAAVGRGRELRLVPLISRVRAGAFEEGIDNYHPGDAEEWLGAPKACGPRTIALHVEGESMEPRYQNADIIFVDPDIAPVHGKDVVVRLPDRDEVTFKRLVIEDERRYLRPLNPGWPEKIIEVPGDARIVGVVIGRYTET